MSAPLLEVRNLHTDFALPETTVEAVRNVSFKLAKGEALALVGESGSGKSVTALSILKLLPYPKASHPAGSVLFNNEELLTKSDRELQRVRGDRIGMIFQEPMTSLNPLHRVGRQIVETLVVHRNMRKEQARKRCVELMELVGIRDPEQRLSNFPHELSGGQRQRVMIAMALANEPDLLIADEPTTALDVTIQTQILDLLSELRYRLGMAVLFITHDLSIVRNHCDRVCVMKEGEVVESGDVGRIFSAPTHPYTRELLDAEPKPKEPVADAGGETVISGRDVKVWFPLKGGLFRRTVGHVKAVDGVDVELKKGRSLGVVGESGSGKTTLGLALLRLQQSDGQIEFLGERIQALSGSALRPLRRRMQVVFQDPFSSLSPRMSAGQIIAEGLRVHCMVGSEEEMERTIGDVLEEVGLNPGFAHRYPHEFSGGQRQRIAIARAMVLKPDFVVLDEPTSALDRSVQAQIIDLLRNLQERHGLTYLFISHDLAVVRGLCDDILVMKDGRVVESGPTEEVINSPRNEYTRRLMTAAFATA